MIFSSVSQCKSSSKSFQQGEGPSRGLLRDCTTLNFAKVRFQLYWAIVLELGQVLQWAAAVLGGDCRLQQTGRLAPICPDPPLIPMITEMSRPARLSPPQPTSNNCSLGWAGLAGGGDTEEMLIAGDPDSDLRQPSQPSSASPAQPAQPSPAQPSPAQPPLPPVQTPQWRPQTRALY